MLEKMLGFLRRDGLDDHNMIGDIVWFVQSLKLK